MRFWHVLTVLAAATLATGAAWQTERHHRQADADAAMREIRDRGIPANLVRFPASGNVLLEAGIAWGAQPADWQRETLERLRVAHGAGHIWRTSDVPYRDADGQLVPPDSAAR